MNQICQASSETDGHCCCYLCCFSNVTLDPGKNHEVSIKTHWILRMIAIGIIALCCIRCVPKQSNIVIEVAPPDFSIPPSTSKVEETEWRAPKSNWIVFPISPPGTVDEWFADGTALDP